MNDRALVIFGHRSFDLQMASKCCEDAVKADSGTKIKKKKSLRRRKGKLVPGRAESEGKNKGTEEEKKKDRAYTYSGKRELF